MRALFAIAGGALALVACSPAPSAEQVRKDVLEERRTAGDTVAGQVGPPAWGDGWEDGVEGRVDFRADCPEPAAPSCEPDTIEYRVAYQREGDEWRLLDIERGAAPK